MTDSPIEFRLTDKEHALALLPIDKYKNPDVYIHPIVVVANEKGYNRDVLGLTPVQAAAMFDSTMFNVACPAHVDRLKATDKYETWPSEEGAQHG